MLLIEQSDVVFMQGSKSDEDKLFHTYCQSLLLSVFSMWLFLFYNLYIFAFHWQITLFYLRCVEFVDTKK